MENIDRREAAGGIVLILTGLAFAGYAAANYSIGTVLRMGPGMVPTALGIVLAVFGGIIVFNARGDESHAPIRVLVPAIILASVVTFGLLIGSFGLLPAVFVSVFIATLADKPFNPVFSLVLAAALCVIAWAVFVFALGLTIPLMRWPN